MRRVLGILGGLIIIALLLVVADRGVLWLAERQQSEQLARDLNISPPPTVKFAGTPFLTQLATARFEQVEVQAAEMTVAGADQPITLRDVDLVLSDVRGITTPVASRIDGTAVVAWDDVAALVGYPITFGGVDASGNGRIKVSYRAEVFGAQVNAEVTGAPRLDADRQRLTLGDPQIGIAGYQLPADLAAQMIDRLVQPVPIELPMGLRLQQLNATEAGLAVSLTGNDVALSG